jgi:sarcosine oxidase delta subunit
MYDKAYEIDANGQTWDRTGQTRLACFHCAKRARDEYSLTIQDDARRAAFNKESEALYKEANDYMLKMAKLSRDHDEAYRKIFGHYPPV